MVATFLQQFYMSCGAEGWTQDPCAKLMHCVTFWPVILLFCGPGDWPQGVLSYSSAFSSSETVSWLVLCWPLTCNLPASASRIAGITGLYPCPAPSHFSFKESKLISLKEEVRWYLWKALRIQISWTHNILQMVWNKASAGLNFPSLCYTVGAAKILKRKVSHAPVTHSMAHYILLPSTNIPPLPGSSAKTETLFFKSHSKSNLKFWASGSGRIQKLWVRVGYSFTSGKMVAILSEVSLVYYYLVFWNKV